MSKATSDPLASYIRRPVVQRMLGNMSARRIDALVRAGVLPAPVKLGARTTLFRRDELEAALEALRSR